MRGTAATAVNQRLFNVAIPLDRAMLCLDCESIYEARGPAQCPACCSAVAWPLSRALNRKVEAVSE